MLKVSMLDDDNTVVFQYSHTISIYSTTSHALVNALVAPQMALVGSRWTNRRSFRRSQSSPGLQCWAHSDHCSRRSTRGRCHAPPGHSRHTRRSTTVAWKRSNGVRISRRPAPPTTTGQPKVKSAAGMYSTGIAPPLVTCMGFASTPETPALRHWERISAPQWEERA